MTDTAAAVATRDFVDHWCGDGFVTGDLARDFADAVDSARWGDDPAGGSLANKDTVVLVVDEAMDCDRATELAERLLATNDPRGADPTGPAGAIRVSGCCGSAGKTATAHAWVLFGRAPVAPFPPCQDDITAQQKGHPPRCGGWLPVTDRD